MKHRNKPFIAWALVIALWAIPYVHAGSSTGGTATPGVGAGSMKAPNETDSGSPSIRDTGVGADAARSSPTTERSNRGKTNGLNKGTNSGANSDVNSEFRGARKNGQ